MYATAQQAMQDGSLIYGRGNVKAVRRGNGFIYWPKQAAAMDSAIQSDDAALLAKIARAKQLVRNRAEDDAAIKKLFPTLLAVAKDDAESEQSQYGEPENAEAADGEADFASAYSESLKAQRAKWNGIAVRNRQRSQFAGSTGRYASPSAVPSKNAKAADSIKSNAKKARQYSAFATSAKLCKVS